MAEMKPPETAEDVLKMVKENQDLQWVDLRFTDPLGVWHAPGIPIDQLEGVLQNGKEYDGSSITGFQEIQESDMLLRPDPRTARIDPTMDGSTLVLICDVWDPVKDQAYSRDPRGIARRAEEYLKTTGIADISYWGPELEFFLLDEYLAEIGPNFARYRLDAAEGSWNSGKDGSLGNTTAPKGGYFPLRGDLSRTIRQEIMKALQDVGIPIEFGHPEVAAAQHEIDMHYSTLLDTADRTLWYVHLAQAMARKHGKRATFLPKPFPGDNGSGMHVHSSLWKGETPLFDDPEAYARLSALGRQYVAGILEHAPAIMALAAPITNSYRRLRRGFEAPIAIAWGSRNRSASIRIPVSKNPKATRAEFRAPDPSSNAYLVFPAILMAGLDGIKRGLEAPEPVGKDIYHGLTAEENAAIKRLPTSLDAALDALASDHRFLLEGGVFTQDFLDMWLKLKRDEVDDLARYPHPKEILDAKR